MEHELPQRGRNVYGVDLFPFFVRLSYVREPPSSPHQGIRRNPASRLEPDGAGHSGPEAAMRWLVFLGRQGTSAVFHEATAEVEAGLGFEAERALEALQSMPKAERGLTRAQSGPVRAPLSESDAESSLSKPSI